MDFIRRQRGTVWLWPAAECLTAHTLQTCWFRFVCPSTAQPNHDPNTHHCLCGADGKPSHQRLRRRLCGTKNPVLKDVFAFSWPDHAGPGHPRAQLYHHQRGVQAQQAPPLRALWTAGSRNQGLSGDGQRETGRGERWRAEQPFTRTLWNVPSVRRRGRFLSFSTTSLQTRCPCLSRSSYLSGCVCCGRYDVGYLFMTWRVELAEEQFVNTFPAVFSTSPESWRWPVCRFPSTLSGALMTGSSCVSLLEMTSFHTCRP